MKTIYVFSVCLLFTLLRISTLQAQTLIADEIILDNTSIEVSEQENLRLRSADDISFFLTGTTSNLAVRDGGSGLPSFTVDVARDRVGINTFPDLGVFDVRGDNLILTRPGVTSSTLASNRFTALGESGGRRGAVNGCDIYGFRSQLSTSNFINVGVTSANAPTISWETTNSNDRLDLRVDNSSSTCGTLVAQFGTGTYELVVYGSALASGGSWVTSDKRFKSNIKKIDNALSLVRQIEGDTYEYKQDNEAGRVMPEGRSLGFVAQDLAKVLPDAVMKDEEGFLAVNYDAVIPLLVEAVKELDSQIQTAKDLQREISDLRSELNQLKGISLEDKEASLLQNIPNPSGADTRIEYSLPLTTQQVSLLIYDMQGKQMATYENLQSGAHQEVTIERSTLKAGMYMYTLVADGKEVATKRMILTE